MCRESDGGKRGNGIGILLIIIMFHRVSEILFFVPFESEGFGADPFLRNSEYNEHIVLCL